jgi:hypothetical protein
MTGRNAELVTERRGGPDMSRFVRYGIWSTTVRRSMKSIVVTIVLAVASLGGASGASAHTLVDPTTLTPPLQPFRVCYQDGPWVKCDTSGVSSVTNEASFDLSCGTVYETSTDTRHATRWYRDGLLVERIVQSKVRGTWSLSPTANGPTVGFMADLSWDERFLVPGDLSSDSEVSHGNFLRIDGMGSLGRETGIWLPDGTHHGLLSDASPESEAQLCALLGA